MQFILIATTYGFVQSHSVGAHEEVLTIREVSIVDVVYNRLEPHRDVMIAGRHIVDVRTTGPLPEGRMLDGAGKHLMPGLWDFHVHVFTAPGEEDLALPLYTLNEISGIRDVGGFRGFKDMRAVAAATERGERVGPRIVLAGAVVDGPPGAWPGQMVARDAEDAKARVREAEAVGWTFIKSYSQLGEAAYLA